MRELPGIIPVYRALTIVNSALARTSSGELELRTIVSTTFGAIVDVVYDLRPSADGAARPTGARSSTASRVSAE